MNPEDNMNKWELKLRGESLKKKYKVTKKSPDGIVYFAVNFSPEIKFPSEGDANNLCDMLNFADRHMPIQFPDKETGIACFKCEMRSGIDCANREKEESTLCPSCLKIVMSQYRHEQAEHLLNMLNEGKMEQKDFDRFIQDCL